MIKISSRFVALILACAGSSTSSGTQASECQVALSKLRDQVSKIVLSGGGPLSPTEFAGIEEENSSIERLIV